MIGVRLPDIALPATDGTHVNLSVLSGRSVVFFYPYTGRPGTPDPPDWDHIPGAHGSTPQARAFSATYEQFQNLSVKVFGVSMQDTGWQREFVERSGLRYPMLSDEDRSLSAALKFETFRAGDRDFLVRATIIINDGFITHLRKPVHPPEDDARQCLALLTQ